LYCEGSGKPGTGQPLVEGIERIKFGYWLKNASFCVDAAAISRDAGRWSSPWMCVCSCAETLRARRRLGRFMPTATVRRSCPRTVGSRRFFGVASRCGM